MSSLENKTFDEIKVGDSASCSRTLTKEDIELFAYISGDMNPAHLDEQYAKSDIFHGIVGHGMWTGALLSSLLGTRLPGPGTIYLSQSLKFEHPVKIGDEVIAKVTVKSKGEKQQVTLETICLNKKGETIISGEAVVIAPAEKIKREIVPLPRVELRPPGRSCIQTLISIKDKLKPLKTAVVHPADSYSLLGAVASAKEGLIEPILVGPEDKIKAIAKQEGIDLSPYKIIPTEHSHAAAGKAVEMARNGEVEALMKGKIHTDELMAAVVDKESGLRTGRRMSHVFILDVPNYPKPLFLTDAALNITPHLEDKKDIVQNAIDLFRTLGFGTPKVAILAAEETVNEAMPATLDATALCKMADRGQITGGILDGPLAFDNAVSKESADIKGINSKVAGDADILIVPDIESGNMLYKQNRFLTGCDGAGIVLGAKVPIILTSRAGSVEARQGSSALALVYTRNREKLGTKA